MAKTNSRTQLLTGQATAVSAATAQGSPATVSDSYSTSIACTCVQVGTATTAAKITVWARGASGIWVALYKDYSFGTAEATYYASFDVPPEYSEVAVEYTPQTVGTSSTLAVDVLEVTAV
jgi:H+/gluconate symporter-like permease